MIVGFPDYLPANCDLLHAVASKALGRFSEELAHGAWSRVYRECSPGGSGLENEQLGVRQQMRRLPLGNQVFWRSANVNLFWEVFEGIPTFEGRKGKLTLRGVKGKPGVQRKAVFWRCCNGACVRVGREADLTRLQCERAIWVYSKEQKGGPRFLGSPPK